MVPLVGIMFGNVIGGITSYLAYKYEMTQALSSWLVGHFSLVLKGRYEIVWLTVPLVILAFLFANHFNIVGLGRDFSQNLGVPYNLVNRKIKNRLLTQQNAACYNLRNSL